jgi:hypothetical protein
MKRLVDDTELPSVTVVDHDRGHPHQRNQERLEEIVAYE